MTDRCLELTDEVSLDASSVGAKAAGLAAALAAGLPVLDGVIVPVRESEAVVSAVSEALATTGSHGRARVAAARVQPDDELVEELRTRLSAYPVPLIVRSSSPLEADGTWSGAFSSFHGVGLDDLATAVRGCWGSAFSVGVLDRAEGTGTPPDQLGLGVLIQPELMPDIGGTARLRADGGVRITATRGPLLPLMEGNVEGETTTVGSGDDVVPADRERELMLAVADLARRVGTLLDHQLIEWAAVDGRVHLLQSIRSAEIAAPATRPASDPVFGSPTALRVATITQRFPGRLGHELVLPWAAAAPSLDLAAPVQPSELEPREAFAAARSGASQMIATIWGGSPRAAAAEAERVLRQLRGDSPGAAAEILAQVAHPAPDQMRHVLGHLEVVRRAVRDAGVADSDAAFWRMTPDDVERALRDEPVRVESRLGVDVWEPFLHGVVAVLGESFEGTAAAPGAGAGRAFVYEEGAPVAVPDGRYVILASEPSHELSSLLWNAAGLVTRAGSSAAHLIEFAHSIGVPSVVACDMPRLEVGAPAPLVAVDGDRGQVHVVWDGTELPAHAAS